MESCCAGVSHRAVEGEGPRSSRSRHPVSLQGTRQLSTNQRTPHRNEIYFKYIGIQYILSRICFASQYGQYGSDSKFHFRTVIIYHIPESFGFGLASMPLFFSPFHFLKDTGEEVNNLQEILNEKEKNPGTLNRPRGLLIALFTGARLNYLWSSFPEIRYQPFIVTLKSAHAMRQRRR